MSIDWLRQAPWLTRRRTTAYARLMLMCCAAVGAGWLLLADGLVDTRGMPIGTDFINVWAAGHLALAGDAPAAYDYARHHVAEVAAVGREVPYFGWHYPPLFLLAAAPLALLPYGWSLAVWMAATLAGYLAVLKRAAGPDGLLLAAAFPAVFVNLGHGQNGFLTAALLGGGLLLLDRRPVAAGVLIGLLTYKPQFGLLIPLALLAQGRWRTIFAAALTFAVLAASSALIFPGIWQAFLGSLSLTTGHVLEQGATGWFKFQSPFAATRMLGGSVAAAYAAQAAATALAAAVVLWLWRRDIPPPLQWSGLVAATLLATPYAMDYDLILLALPLAWMAGEGLRTGFLPWEKTILAWAWLMPLVARTVAMGTSVPVGMLTVVLLLAVVVRRALHPTPTPPHRGDKL